MRIELHDVELNYEVEGAGPPMVLVHGGGLDLQTWEDMVPLLAPHFTVYRFDMRGFGASKRLTDAPLSMESWADDLAGLIETLGLDRPVVAGWSLGGAVSIECAYRHPGYAGAMILLGAPGKSQVNRDRAGFDTRQDMINKGYSAAEVIDATFDFTKTAFSEHSRQHNPRALQKIRDGLERNFCENYAEMVAALQDRDINDSKLARVECPTLVLVGDEDARTPVAMAAELNRGIASSYMKVLPDMGHYYAYEDAARCAEVMLEFLAAHYAPQPAAVPAA